MAKCRSYILYQIAALDKIINFVCSKKLDLLKKFKSVNIYTLFTFCSVEIFTITKILRLPAGFHA